MAATCFASCETKESVVTPVSNPFEYIGKEHNRLMDIVLASKNVQTLDDVYNIIIDELGDEYATVVSKEECIASWERYKGYDDITVADLVEDGYLTQRQSVRVSRVFSVLDSSSPFGSVISELEEMEQFVLGDNDLTSYERDAMLVYLSIARNSSVYWYEALGDAKLPWKKIGKYDLVGAISGGIIAGPSGALITGAFWSAAAAIFKQLPDAF